MITIKGYKEVNYDDFVLLLEKRKNELKKTDISIANDISVNSQTTVNNAFATGKQKVSDRVLTKIAVLLGMEVAVIYQNGERKYFIKLNTK